MQLLKFLPTQPLDIPLINPVRDFQVVGKDVMCLGAAGAVENDTGAFGRGVAAENGGEEREEEEEEEGEERPQRAGYAGCGLGSSCLCGAGAATGAPAAELVDADAGAAAEVEDEAGACVEAAACDG